MPIPERLMPILQRRIEGHAACEPAITSPKGSRLGVENWKRAVGWPTRIPELGRPTVRVHDLRHTYASLARSAGADMKLHQVTMGHVRVPVLNHCRYDAQRWLDHDRVVAVGAARSEANDDVGAAAHTIVRQSAEWEFPSEPANWRIDINPG